MLSPARACATSRLKLCSTAITRVRCGRRRGCSAWCAAIMFRGAGDRITRQAGSMVGVEKKSGSPGGSPEIEAGRHPLVQLNLSRISPPRWSAFSQNTSIAW